MNLVGGVSSSDRVDDEDEDLYTAEEELPLVDQDPAAMVVDASLPAAEGNAAAAAGLTQLNDGGLSRELEEEAQLSLAIQYSMESSNWSMEDEEEQLKRALELSKTLVQQNESPSRANKSREKGLESVTDAIKAAGTVQLDVFAGYDCDLIRVDIAFGKKVTQRQVEDRVEHRAVKNMSEYHKNCLELIKRKHAVDILVQGTIITVSGFKDFVYGGMWDVKLMLEQLPNYVSDREIQKSVQWVHQDPATSDTTPYSPDANVFIEHIWRKKMTQVDILLDNQPHTIDFEKMQEYNIASGKSVKISRKMVDVEDLEKDMPGKEHSALHLSESTS